ncbi:hypothetical protein I7I48_03913 [Histoplasma ohiense]|nr:hypothetical protein I7I48_03913 [Histoplasma ohiense (nom. inval.)]
MVNIPTWTWMAVFGSNCAVYVPNKMTNCGHSHLFLFDGRNMISPSRYLRLLSWLVRLYVWMRRLGSFRSDGRSRGIFLLTSNL